ncbi:hypothetical protein C9890_0359 [Perkinsus sp. BL_2016]|nr:hypothetical protein C9890_0359 [Perkinsus sp. BL_2016]
MFVTFLCTLSSTSTLVQGRERAVILQVLLIPRSSKRSIMNDDFAPDSVSGIQADPARISGNKDSRTQQGCRPGDVISEAGHLLGERPHNGIFAELRIATDST